MYISYSRMYPHARGPRACAHDNRDVETLICGVAMVTLIYVIGMSQMYMYMYVYVYVGPARNGGGGGGGPVYFGPASRYIPAAPYAYSPYTPHMQTIGPIFHSNQWWIG